MNIPRKAWYVQLFFLMSWFNAKAFDKKGPIKDPTDVCPMLRMILIWGPLSIVWLLGWLAMVVICILFVAGIILLIIHSVLTLTFVAFMLKALKVIGVIGAVAGAFALVGWLFDAIPTAFRMANESPLAERFRKRFPRREKPERPYRPMKVKAPKPPSGLKLFFIWLDGKLHGWCSPLTVVG